MYQIFPNLSLLFGYFLPIWKKIQRFISGLLSGRGTIRFSTLQALPHYALLAAHSQRRGQSAPDH